MQPILTTSRLILRTISLGDASDMYEYAKLDQVGPLAGWHPHTSLYETKEVIAGFMESIKQGKINVWAIILKETGKMIGTIELYNLKTGYLYELGYSSNPIYHNYGYMSEAAMKVVEYAFTNTPCVKIEVGTFPNNLASIKVAENVGFKYEGILRNHYLRSYDNLIFDEAFYGITKRDFERNKRQ